MSCARCLHDKYLRFFLTGNRVQAYFRLMLAKIPRPAVVSADKIDQLLRAAVPEIKYEFDRANRATTGILSGEIRLLMALLQDAVEIVQGKRVPGCYGNSERSSDPAAEARRWIAGKLRAGWSWEIAFEDVCIHLNLDPQAVRKAVLGKKKRAA